MKYTFNTLKNGLRVVTVPVQEVESVTTMVLVGAGSRYEERFNSGISHFLEHMAFKGTQKRPTAQEIAALIDGIGAESNAFTGKEMTGYYIKSASRHLELSLDVLSDMLSNLLLNSEEIDKERGVILEEMNLYEDTPSRKIGDVFEELLYGDAPMGWDIAGHKDVIKKIKREDFLNYMKKFYSAHNMVIVIAGKFDEKTINSNIEKYFGTLEKFEISSYIPVQDTQEAAQVFLKHKATEQAHFALGVRTTGLKNDGDRHPLSILSAILGGGMSSRLFTEIREKRGLAYYVRTYSEKYLDCGYISSFAGVDKNRIDEAIKVVIDEYQKITKEGAITEKELEKAREYSIGHFVLDLEDTRSIASFFGTTQLLEERIETPKDIIEGLRKVTLDDLLKVAKEYLQPERLNLSIIGDFQDQERFEKLVK